MTPDALPRPKRSRRFALVSLALPILAALVCALTAPGTRAPGEMFSMGLLVCLFTSVGGAAIGFIFAVVAVIRRESPVLCALALILNAAIVGYAYL